MTVDRGHILPFFIPHLGCPQQCVFCDQRKISGGEPEPSVAELEELIAEGRGERAELAFYGGSFTAIDPAVQTRYLEVAAAALERGDITGIRVSTRPDAIDAERLALLQRYQVRTVELGVQSLDDRVLSLARRGHTAESSLQAVRALQKGGFRVGVQLMPGLPGDTPAKCFRGAETILGLRPDFLRIYPVVVIAGTELAASWQRGEYQALTLEAAVQAAADLTALAARHGVRVIRTGLNPSAELERQALAGAYHPAFGHLVQSYLWRQRILMLIELFLLAADDPGADADCITASAPVTDTSRAASDSAAGSSRAASEIINLHSFCGGQTAADGAERTSFRRSDFAAIVVERRELPKAFGQDSANSAYYAAALGLERVRIKGGELPSGDCAILLQDGRRLQLTAAEFIEHYCRERAAELL